MLNAPIQNTPFSNDSFDDIFPGSALCVNDMGISYYCGDDSSFRSTIRAMYALREECFKKLYISAHKYRIGYEEAKDVVNYIKNSLFLSGFDNNLTIVFTRGASGEFISNVSDEFKSEGFKSLDDITIFFKPRFDAAILVSDHRSVVVVNAMNYSISHEIQSIFPRLFPSVFGEDFTDVEKELFKSLRFESGAADEYLGVLQKIYDSFDFESILVDRNLGDYEIIAINQRIQNLKAEIEYTDSEVSRLEEKIGGMLKSNRERHSELLGFEMSKNSTQTGEIASYIKRMKNIKFISRYDRSVTISLCGILNYIDRSLAERISEKSSSILADCESSILYEDRKLLWNAAFGRDNVINLKVCATYLINPDGLSDGVSGVYPQEYRDYIPNPHIEHYRCLGDYKDSINAYAHRGECIDAIEECIASVSSVNFGEAPTLRYFVDDIFNVYANRKAWILPDGSEVDVKEAIKWLKEGRGQE